MVKTISPQSKKTNLDLYGVIASVACALHCAFMPLLLTVSALGSIHFLAEHWVEWVMIGISALFALGSLFPSFLRQHQNQIPLIIVLVGFSLITLGKLNETHEEVLSVVGALTITIAHVVNWWLVGRCVSRQRATVKASAAS